MHIFIAVAISLLAGAISTTVAEHKFGYNLYEFVVEKLKGAESAVKGEIKKL